VCARHVPCLSHHERCSPSRRAGASKSLYDTSPFDSDPTRLPTPPNVESINLGDDLVATKVVVVSARSLPTWSTTYFSPYNPAAFEEDFACALFSNGKIKCWG
jgi:hypothetical protein